MKEEYQQKVLSRIVRVCVCALMPVCAFAPGPQHFCFPTAISEWVQDAWSSWKSTSWFQLTSSPSLPTHLCLTHSRHSLISHTVLLPHCWSMTIRLIARSETLPAVTLGDKIKVSATLITSTSYTCSVWASLTAIKCNQSPHHCGQLTMNVLTSETQNVPI